MTRNYRAVMNMRVVTKKEQLHRHNSFL